MEKMENKKAKTKELSKDIQVELQKIGYDNVTLEDTKQILFSIIKVFKNHILDNNYLQLHDFGKFEVIDYKYNDIIKKQVKTTKKLAFSPYLKFKNEIKDNIN